LPARYFLRLPGPPAGSSSWGFDHLWLGNRGHGQFPAVYGRWLGTTVQQCPAGLCPVLARNLNADYHVSAVSGIGLVRNYSFQYDARPLPEVYDLLYFEQTDSPAGIPNCSCRMCW